MADYEPLDLAEYLNGGLTELGDGAMAEIGPRHFRGLPFAIGDDPSRCFVALDGDSGEVRVPVGSSAFRIVFAHRLVASEIDDGGPVGVHVADYVIFAGEWRAARRPYQGAVRNKLGAYGLVPGGVRLAVSCCNGRQAPVVSIVLRGRGRNLDVARQSTSRRRPRATSCGAGVIRNRTWRWNPFRSCPRVRRL